MKNNLNQTKIKLSILFTLLVFFIAFILEIVYFWVKYANINLVEKRDFEESTKIFTQRLKENNWEISFLKFPKEKQKQERWWPRWPGFRVSDFFITDNTWNIVFQNINENLEKDIDFNKLKENQTTKNDEIYLKKIYIWDIWNNMSYIYFIKKQAYDLFDLLKDLIFSFMINLIMSVWIYFIWYIFVNKNLKPVEDILNDLTDFIHNANHELKTPISIINSNLQLINATKNYEEDLINNSIDEIKRLSELIEWLSNLSNISSSKETSVINLNSEINEIVNELNSLIEEKNIKIDIKSDFELKINANKYYFYILFSNLLRNAIKYNIDNGFISIEIQKNKLFISNSWIEINKEEQEKIFDRFYKADNSRNSEWFGIWLSLVKKICDIYWWKISIVSKNNYTTFLLSFKK